MRSSRNIGTRVLLAASLVALSSATLAQDNSAAGSTVVSTTAGTDTIDPTLNGSASTTGTDPLLNETPAPVREDDDNDFPWGLLGLLGLAGLLGRKKKDDIHVDARNDRRNV